MHRKRIPNEKPPSICDRLNLPPRSALAKRCPETHPRRSQTKRATHPPPQTLLCKHAPKSTPTAKYPQRLSSSRQHSQASPRKLGYGCMFDLRNPIFIRQDVGVYNAGSPSDGCCWTVVQCIVIAYSSFLSHSIPIGRSAILISILSTTLVGDFFS